MSAERRLSTVCKFIEALLASDESAARGCLSDNFGIHSSDDLDRFLVFSLSEFKRRHFLLDGGYSVVFEREVDEVSFYAVLDASGRLLFEEEYFFDEFDKIKGNQRLFDVVTKLHFVGDRAYRGIGLPRVFSRHARVLNEQLVWTDVGTIGTAGSTVVKYEIDGDDLLSRNIHLRIIGASEAQTIKVIARGRESRHFVDHMFCVIDGSRVIVPVERMNIWALNVLLRDGRWITIEHPNKSVYEFSEPVLRVVLTDALDHDWESVCEE